MTPDPLDLQLPVFDGAVFPPPTMTLDEWVEWLDWCRRELVSAEALESQIHDAAATPVGQPFVLL